MVLSLAEHADQVSTALQLHARLSAEGDTVLRSLQGKLSELNRKLAPIHERATALTWAEENITLAKAETNVMLQHIDATRKVCRERTFDHVLATAWTSARTPLRLWPSSPRVWQKNSLGYASLLLQLALPQ